MSPLGKGKSFANLAKPRKQEGELVLNWPGKSSELQESPDKLRSPGKRNSNRESTVKQVTPVRIKIKRLETHGRGKGSTAAGNRKS